MRTNNTRLVCRERQDYGLCFLHDSNKKKAEQKNKQKKDEACKTNGWYVFDVIREEDADKDSTIRKGEM